jgi:hypothetical protein
MYEKLGAVVESGRERWYKTQPAAIALFTSPGMVMIYNGQEFGEDYWLPQEGAVRVLPRPLRWQQYENDFIGQRLRWLYSKLAAIRTDHPALRGPHFFPATTHPDGYGILNEHVVIFHRYGKAEAGLTRYLIVINYGDRDEWITVPFSTDGEWQDLLNDSSVHALGFRFQNYHVPSNWGSIFYQLAT